MTLYLLWPEVDGFLPILCIGPVRPVAVPAGFLAKDRFAPESWSDIGFERPKPSKRDCGSLN